MGRLEDRVILVTGAARGLGLAIARACVAEGARVVLSDMRDDLGERAAAELGAAARYEHLDVREEAEWSEVVARIAEDLGGLDGLVNNAGITGFEQGDGPQDPEHASLRAWRSVHATNLDGVFLGCREALRAMRRRGRGAIVNVASRSGVVGVPAAAAYASSKAAVVNHTRSVALHAAATGLAVRCNAILPAAILTEMWEPMLGRGPEREERMRAVVKDTPLRRFGQPEEVARLAVFLLGDDCTYATGASFHVDGGLLAGSAALPEGEG